LPGSGVTKIELRCRGRCLSGLNLDAGVVEPRLRLLSGDAINAQTVGPLEFTYGGLCAAAKGGVNQSFIKAKILQLLLQAGNSVAPVPKAHSIALNRRKGFDGCFNTLRVFRFTFK
jgi:hypothetical protein